MSSEQRDDHYPIHLAAGTEKAKERDALFQKIVNELKTEDRYVNFFNGYRSDSVESFILSYANQKAYWLSMEEDHRRWLSYNDDAWLKGAFVAFEQIQQKKLFNVQCLWRAEKLVLKDLDITDEFQDWEEKILMCPLIPKIEQDEIDFYIRYLNESSLEKPFDELCDFQLYEYIRYEIETGKLRDEDRKEEFMFNKPPVYYNPWYRFYDQEYGTDSMLLLPDLRKQKEEHYIQIRQEEYRRVHREEIDERERTRDKRKWLYGFRRKFLDQFVKENESKKVFDLYMEDRRNNELFEITEWPNYAVEKLQKIPVPYYPMEPADDWRDAVEKTWERYRREQVIEFLPQAYEMYLQHLGEKWSYPGWKDSHWGDQPGPMTKTHKEMIMEGRRLKGEPEDFNF